MLDELSLSSFEKILLILQTIIGLLKIPVVGIIVFGLLILGIKKLFNKIF